MTRITDILQPHAPSPPSPRAGKLVVEPRGDYGFNIRFPYDPLMVDVVKFGLPRKATWDPQSRLWHVGEDPLDVQALDVLVQKHGFTLTQPAEARLIAAQNRVHADGVVLRSRLKPLRSKLKRVPYPFQHAGIQFITEKKKVLVADDVGLGKTLQTVVALEEMQAYPAVIVCPAVVKWHWRNEFDATLAVPRRIHTIEGRAPAWIPADTEVVIINWDLLPYHVDTLRQLKPKAVVGDEMHYVKNHKAQRSKAMKELMDGIEVRIGLTGTPLVNRNIFELAAILIQLDRIDSVGGFNRLVDRYGQFENTPWGIKPTGIRFGEQLNGILRASCMMRRKKEDVLTEMPPKTRSRVEVELTNQADYRKAEREFLEWMRSKVKEGKRTDAQLSAAERAEALVRLTTLRRVAGLGKVEHAIALARDLLEDDQAVVLFTQHKDVAHAIVDALRKDTGVSLLTGDTKDREHVVKEFGVKTRVFVATIDAAGTGLDGLQRHASHVAFVELPWTPAKLNQAEGRLDRMGQTKPVNAYYFLGQKTIDTEVVYPTLEAKEAAFKAVVDGETPDESSDVMGAVLQKFEGLLHGRTQ